MRKLNDMVDMCGGVTAATLVMSSLLTEGECDEDLLATARAANNKARKAADGQGVPISDRTLFRWYGKYREEGWWGLLPAPVAAKPISVLTDDVAAVIKAYSSAAGSARNLTHVAQRVTAAMGRPFDDWRRLYDQARRALPKLDQTRLIKARHKGKEQAAKLPFKRRDTSSIVPLDVWLVDGHTFKSKVRHPDHGAPFAPEVTLVIDAASRKVVGWSVSLSESTIAVGDALRHAVAHHGIPAIVYSDNGAGEKAKRFDCPVVGLFSRLGSEHRTGIPGHPQGHGLIERSWQSHMIKCARQFGSYQGQDADSKMVRDVRMELDKEQRAIKRAQPGEVVQLSAKAPTWKQFMDAVAKSVHEYNTQHRHRALPKHESGPHAGKHMTPAEAWDAMLDPSHQELLDGPALRSLFMPAVLRTAQRGEVRFLNNAYFSADLMQVDGQQVSVRYDIHDARKVQVYALDGQFVCEAEWGANRIDYFPKAVIEMAREKRVRGIVKRREAQIETAMRELQPTLPAPSEDLVVFSSMPAVEAAELVERVDAPQGVLPAASERPFFESEGERYEWLMRHRGDWRPEDTTWLAAYVASDDYEHLAEYYASRGLAKPDDTELFKTAG